MSRHMQKPGTCPRSPRQCARGAHCVHHLLMAGFLAHPLPSVPTAWPEWSLRNAHVIRSLPCPSPSIAPATAGARVSCVAVHTRAPVTSPVCALGPRRSLRGFPSPCLCLISLCWSSALSTRQQVHLPRVFFPHGRVRASQTPQQGQEVDKVAGPSSPHVCPSLPIA